MSDAEDEYPEIGKRKRGMILVCHGDDRPSEFVDWLESLVRDFEELFNIASEHGIKLTASGSNEGMFDVMDFCQQIGIEFESKFWESYLISGIYQTGWLKVGTVRTARSNGKKLIQYLHNQTHESVRSKVIKELVNIKDLEIFLERTADDRNELRRKINDLTSSLNDINAELADIKNSFKKVSENDTSEIDRSCLQLALSLLSQKPKRVVAGPLVLWDDGIVYAIDSWGGVSIPEHSSPARLLNEIQKSGRRVVFVQDTTIIGRWLSGPKYRKGPVHISGWLHVWSAQEKQERSFVVNPSDYASQVRQIHEILAKDRGCYE